MTKRTYVKFPIAALLDPNLSDEAVRTLGAYLVRADDRTGRTTAGTTRIAADRNLAVRQIQRHRKALIAAGHLTVSGAKRSANGGLIKEHRIVTKASPEDVLVASPEDVLVGPKRHRKTPKASPEDVLVASPEDAISRDSFIKSLDQDSLFDREETPDDVDLAISAWNNVAVERGLPASQRPSPSLRRSIGARLAECDGMVGWNHALDQVRAAPFLQGQSDSGWRCSLDWLARAANFSKVMAGNYSARLRKSRGAEQRDIADQLIEEADNNEAQ